LNSLSTRHAANQPPTPVATGIPVRTCRHGPEHVSRRVGPGPYRSDWLLGVGRAPGCRRLRAVQEIAPASRELPRRAGTTTARMSRAGPGSRSIRTTSRIIASRNAGHSNHRSTAWSEGRAPNIHLANPPGRTLGSGSMARAANVRGRLQPWKRSGRRPAIGTAYPPHRNWDHVRRGIPERTPRPLQRRPRSGAPFSAPS
jgi:hypothetical protein